MRPFLLPIPLFHVLQALLTGLVWLATGWRVEGRRHLPRRGGLLVVSNHLSNGDPFLLSVALPRPVAFMSKVELFRVPLLGGIIRFFGNFPVDRGTADRQAVRYALDLLAAGHCVGMFPEGTRSRSRVMAPGHPGLGLLATRSGAPILPVAIWGGERLVLWPRPTVRVRIGRPFQLPATTGRRDNQATVDLIMGEVAALLPPAYRGHYAAAATAAERVREEAST